ncbi:MAG TPA: FAD:protein FMN transferase [Candidatus Saccharimonadales bacterium]|nr:FAD:protein FMN transferase [Candidatus Saccharimonadales bacterium]
MQSNKLSKKPRVKEFSFVGIGTSWKVVIYDDMDIEAFNLVKEKVKKRVEDFDQNYSRFKGNSLIGLIAKKAGTYPMPEDFNKLYSFYKKMYKITNGQVTPLIGQTIADLGYDANYSFKEKHQLNPVPEWEEVMDFDGSNLKVKRPVLLDFGAAGKGYLVDEVALVLNNLGVNAYCIDASGDILYENPKRQISIGLEDPVDPNLAIGVVEINSGSVCGSAINRRKWLNHNHIIEPISQKSVTDKVATWALAKSAMLADGLATSLFFVEPLVLKRHFSFEYVTLDKEHIADYSPYFNDKLFIKT